MILLNVNCQIDLLSCDRKKVHTTTRGEREKNLNKGPILIYISFYIMSPVIIYQHQMTRF